MSRTTAAVTPLAILEYSPCRIAIRCRAFDENTSPADPEKASSDEPSAGMRPGSGRMGSRRLLMSVAVALTAIGSVTAVHAASAAVSEPALETPQPTASSFDPEEEAALWHRQDLLSDLRYWIETRPGIKTSGYVTNAHPGWAGAAHGLRARRTGRRVRRSRDQRPPGRTHPRPATRQGRRTVHQPRQARRHPPTHRPRRQPRGKVRTGLPVAMLNFVKGELLFAEKNLDGSTLKNFAGRYRLFRSVCVNRESPVAIRTITVVLENYEQKQRARIRRELLDALTYNFD